MKTLQMLQQQVNNNPLNLQLTHVLKLQYLFLWKCNIISYKDLFGHVSALLKKYHTVANKLKKKPLVNIM